MTDQAKDAKKPPIEVLLVDDEPDMLEVISETLKDQSISCYCASSGEMAITAFRELQPKLIVSDYNMPGLNGMELFRFLRDLGNRAPVIWLTGNATPEVQREAWLRGVLNIFQKPFEVGDLAQHVKQYLKMTPEQIIELRPKFLSQKLFTNVSIDLETALYKKLQKKCLESSTSLSRFVTDQIEKALS
jgi:CheY-like chemotaxis protein